MSARNFNNGDFDGDVDILAVGATASFTGSYAITEADITDGNVALSSRRAEARIEYVGDGYLSERARPGLIPRIFNWLGLW